MYIYLCFQNTESLILFLEPVGHLLLVGTLKKWSTRSGNGWDIFSSARPWSDRGTRGAGGGASENLCPEMNPILFHCRTACVFSFSTNVRRLRLGSRGPGKGSFCSPLPCQCLCVYVSRTWGHGGIIVSCPFRATDGTGLRAGLTVLIMRQFCCLCTATTESKSKLGCTRELSVHSVSRSVRQSVLSLCAALRRSSGQERFHFDK